MYNRYIPQQDGSYRRKQEPDAPRAEPEVRRVPPPSAPEVPCSPVQASSPPAQGTVSGFLKRLLPRDFDTGDLIVVLLLLLMAGDKPEDKNTALLTLALYCFL